MTQVRREMLLTAFAQKGDYDFIDDFVEIHQDDEDYEDALDYAEHLLTEGLQN